MISAAALPDIAYILDPRFPGGTSSAVARELRVVCGLGYRVSVYGITSAMFRGADPAPVLAEALEDLGLDLVWDPPAISADRVILHNPAFLKFDRTLAPRILARSLIVVTHENLIRPGGAEGFDMDNCLDLIDRASLAAQKTLAPISPSNRAGVMSWLADRPAWSHWGVLPEDWFNICDFDLIAPSTAPRDRRGRHSRPGYEKFPDLAAMEACFPAHAETNLILGADTFIAEGTTRPHWRLEPFRAMPVDAFLAGIDIFVYFTAPTWRESFGRVIAEAIAAGKLVITDRDTAQSFGKGVIGARPADVDQVVSHHLAAPSRYRDRVCRAQADLAAYSAKRFGTMFAARMAERERAA
ncbi:hypothetical protein [Maritimibacter fusiformis]|uniref:Glycosyl transferase family 1 n=1 Tax=Maritimibacter fusiformis TaxID=2603819 RepID=A0A5D0RKT1_9RHOB|nr:hypothetical protein [Maritimibacter fusiformis]TYB81451.1 hypothetical protein FVF75_10115 [Maritimibacter fusiformis]